MSGLGLFVAAVLAAATPDAAVAAEAAGEPLPAAGAAVASPAPAQGPDLELHVPRAEVEKVSLDVENLQARLDLDTRVANLVSISAGVVATVQKMKLQLEGVRAETHLVVRLDRVSEVLQRALGAIERNPAAASAGAPSPPVPVAGAAPAAGGPAAPPRDASIPLAAPQPAQHKE